MGLFDLFKKKTQNVKNCTNISVSFEEKKDDYESAKSDIRVFPLQQGEKIIPIEERIEGKEPTCDGLYPHEVLVLSFANRFIKNDTTQVARYWWNTYGIKDVTKVIDNLVNKNYVQIGTLQDGIKLEKLSKIKDELRKRNLKVSGNKDDLADRLLNFVDENELRKIFYKRPYFLTSDGQEIINKYEWIRIPYIHSHSIENLDIWSLTELIQQPPLYLNYRDKIWEYLNMRGIYHMKNGHYGLYRNSRYTMSEFVAEEGKYAHAFRLLCEVIVYDLSGLSNGFQMKYLKIYKDYYFPYSESNCRLGAGIISRIKKYSDNFGWSTEQLKQELLNGMQRIQLPFSVFTHEECADIVIAEIIEA